MSDNFEKENDRYTSYSDEHKDEQKNEESSRAVDTPETGQAQDQIQQMDQQKPQSQTQQQTQGTTYSWVNPKLASNQNNAGAGNSNAYGQNTSGQHTCSQNAYGQNTGGQHTCSQNAYGQNTYRQNTYSQQQAYNPNANTQHTAYQFSAAPSENGKKKKKKGGAGKFAKLVGAAVVFGLVASVVFQGVNIAGDYLRGGDEKVNEETNPIRIPSTTTAPKSDGDYSKENVSSTGNKTVAEVARTAMPSVVAITNVSVQETYDWFGRSQSYEVPSSGSGIIVGQNEKELLIATNNHVVEGASTLSVCFIDESVVDAQIKGTDPENDLAVIAVKLDDISGETQTKIKIAALGDSDALELGEQVVAIGNALGIGQSITSGYVSALNRTINDSETKLIQTDAAINPGNSGGALLNMDGEVIGINSSKFADTDIEGIGFAIPLSTAEPILQNLMNLETRTKVSDEDAAWLGITYKPISSDVAKQIAEMYNFPEGVLIQEVTEGGPAAEAGIQAGDILTKFGGVSVASYETLLDRLQYYSKGESVEVEIARSDNGTYKAQTFTIVLGSKDDMPDTVKQNKNK